MKTRIGFGYDIHQLKKGDGFILGGVKIKSDKKIIAHSDGDVLIHAICDSILGALSIGDIGKLFPNNDLKYKNISSLILLKKVSLLLKSNKYKISNIDSTIILEKPKISNQSNKMVEIISEILKINKSQISIKATTNEKQDSLGKNNSISAYAVCLIQK